MRMTSFYIYFTKCFILRFTLDGSTRKRKKDTFVEKTNKWQWADTEENAENNNARRKGAVINADKVKGPKKKKTKRSKPNGENKGSVAKVGYKGDGKDYAYAEVSGEPSGKESRNKNKPSV